MTASKGEYIRKISVAIVSGDLDVEAFRNYSDTEEIVDEMVRIRGIGKWTAELTVLRGIHKLDAFPADDVALRRLIAGFYRKGERIDAGEARKIAEQWGSYKGLAAFYLEIADLMGISP
jgi:DNA-3-methyladenine glycosylase II